MDELLEFLYVYRALLSAALFTLLAVLTLKIWWQEAGLFVKSSWYRFPLVGKGARLARNTRRADNGWFQSEMELCADFYKHYREVRPKPTVYRRAASYLGKVNELGRSPLGVGGWILISVLVFLEALGFSYVLAGWTVPGASEATQVGAAFGISIVVSIILVMFTHYSGHELYLRGMVSVVRSQWAANRNAENISSRSISINNDHEDDDKPHYVQTANRLKTKANLHVPKPAITIATVILVTLVAVGATYVREQKLEQTLLEETTLSGGNSFSFPTLNKLPDIVAKPQQSAEAQAADEVTSTKRKGGIATFIVLAILFVFIQIVGVLLGYKTGFAGKQSKEAWGITHRFPTEEDYIDFYRAKSEAIADIAQGHLSRLQSKMDERIADTSIDSASMKLAGNAENRTFTQFVLDKKEDDSRLHKSSELDKAESNLRKSPSAPKETPEQREARLRREVLEEIEREKRAETEDEMKARLRRELMAEQRTVTNR